jgi:hypothetical protein
MGGIPPAPVGAGPDGVDEPLPTRLPPPVLEGGLDLAPLPLVAGVAGREPEGGAVREEELLVGAPGFGVAGLPVGSRDIGFSILDFGLRIAD